MLKITNRSSVIGVLFIVTFLFTSCDKKRIFDEYLPISNQKWSKHNTLQFAFTATDTLQKHNLFINVRNNKDYPFSNLFLIAQMNFPDGNVITDTLEYDMADGAGRFLGDGTLDIKDNKLFYKEKIIFPAKGTYTFKVRQSMRKNGNIDGIEELEGLTHVGFRIEKTE